jgi:hypothetical protein
MLTLQARVTLISYVILMVAFFIPLKGDMDLLNKFGTSLIMLLPVLLSVYIINCMVTGSKAKLGLGCNAIAWIESLYILIIAVIVLLYNIMNSKKDTIENFYNTGSCGSDAVYGSAVPYGSCIVTSNTCGSTAGSQAYKEEVLGSGSGCQDRITYQPCEIVCGSCSDEGDYGSWSNGSDSCEPVGSGCGSTAGSQSQTRQYTGNNPTECNKSQNTNRSIGCEIECGSCGKEADYTAWTNGSDSCEPVGSDCGSTAGSQSQTRQYTGNNDACNIPENKNRIIECEIECNNNTGSCGSDAVYGSAESYGSCTQIGNDCGSTAGSQAYRQTASGCSDRITYQPCNIDCLPNCEYSIARFGSGCVINNNSFCVERVNMVANGSNCIGSQSYTEYIGCYGSSRSDCGTGTLDDNGLNSIIQEILDLLSNGGTEYSNIDSEKIQRIVSIMTPQDIQNLDTESAKESFLQSVDNSFGSNSSRTYDTSNISDIEDIINTAKSNVSLQTPGGDANANSDGDASQSGSENNILHNFITAIQDYGPSSDSFTYSAEPVGSDSDRYKYCINNVDFGNQDCIIVGPGIIEKD